MIPVPAPDFLLSMDLDVVARGQRAVGGKMQVDPEYVVAYAVPGMVFTAVPQRILTMLGKQTQSSPVAVLKAGNDIRTNWKLREPGGVEWIVETVQYWPSKTDPALLVCELKEAL